MSYKESLLSFESVQEIVWPELQNFIEFMSRDFAVKNNESLPQQLYFELESRLKYAETLWDMYVNSLKRAELAHQFGRIKKIDTSAYFEALGKAKMVINMHTNPTENVKLPELVQQK